MNFFETHLCFCFLALFLNLFKATSWFFAFRICELQLRRSVGWMIFISIFCLIACHAVSFCHQTTRNFSFLSVGWNSVLGSLQARSSSPFQNTEFLFVFRVIPAKCVMLRCKVWRTNLLTVVDLFTTPNFIAL